MSLRFGRYTQEQFIDAIAKARSLRQALLFLGVMPKESNYCAARKRIEALKLDTSHFSRSGDAYKRGRQVPINNELSNLEILCPNCHAFTPIYRGRGRKMINRGKGRRTLKFGSA